MLDQKLPTLSSHGPHRTGLPESYCVLQQVELPILARIPANSGNNSPIAIAIRTRRASMVKNGIPRVKLLYELKPCAREAIVINPDTAPPPSNPDLATGNELSHDSRSVPYAALCSLQRVLWPHFGFLRDMHRVPTGLRRRRASVRTRYPPDFVTNW